MHSAVSSELYVHTRGVVAGCSGATTLLKAVLMLAIEPFLEARPCCKLGIVVDDLQLVRMGRTQE
eukprot:2147392-Prorocentrum_lima.AAC.1